MSMWSLMISVVQYTRGHCTSNPRQLRLSSCTRLKEDPEGDD